MNILHILHLLVNHSIILQVCNDLVLQQYHFLLYTSHKKTFDFAVFKILINGITLYARELYLSHASKELLNINVHIQLIIQSIQII